MQSLQDILGNKDFDKPSEIEFIKDFVRKKYNSDVSVSVQERSITIVTSSASLAGSLRGLLHKLKRDLNTDKKLFIRIGSN